MPLGGAHRSSAQREDLSEHRLRKLRSLSYFGRLDSCELASARETQRDPSRALRAKASRTDFASGPERNVGWCVGMAIGVRGDTLADRRSVRRASAESYIQDLPQRSEEVSSPYLEFAILGEREPKRTTSAESAGVGPGRPKGRGDERAAFVGPVGCAGETHDRGRKL